MRNFKKLLSLILVCVLSLVLFVGCGEKAVDEYTNTDTTVGDKNNTNNTSDDTNSATNNAQIDSAITYYADIDVKDYGMITVKLDQKEAPATVANFISLSESGFYDGLTFHRVIYGFMIQGGCPLGTGTGGPGHTIKGEFKSNGIDNPIKHTRGVISMARSMMPNSAGSQFFIMHKDSPHLDGQYAAFGHVVEGIEVVDEIAEVDTDFSDKPLDPVVIKKVTIE